MSNPTLFLKKPQRVFLAVLLILCLSSGLRPAFSQEKKANEDGLELPLPEGAIHRFGSLRLRHLGTVHAIGFSPDNALLASGGHDGYVRIWDVRNGKQHSAFETGKSIACLAFSPSNRHFLVWGDFGGHVNFWNVQTMQHQRVPITNWGGVGALVFVPKTKMLVAANDQGSLFFFDAEAQTELFQLKEVHKGEVRSLAASRDGRYLASAGIDGKIVIYDIPFRKQVKTITAPEWGLWHVDLSHDSELLGYSTALKCRIYDWKKDLELYDLRRSSCVQFRNKKDWIFARAPGNSVEMFDYATGQIANTFQHSYGASKFAVSADQKLLAIAGAHLITLFDVDEAAEVVSLPGHLGPVDALAISPDEAVLVSGGEGNRVYLWDLKKRAFSKELALPSWKNLENDWTQNKTTAIVFLSPSTFALSGSAASVYLADLVNRQLKASRCAADSRVHALTYSPKNKILVTYDWDGIRGWDLESQRQLYAISTGRYGGPVGEMQVRSLTYSGATDCFLMVGAPTAPSEATPTMSAREVAEAHSRKLEALNRIHVWSPEKGKLTKSFPGIGERSFRIAASPTESIAAYIGGLRNEELALLDLKVGQVTKLHVEKEQFYSALAFSKDGKYLAVGTEKGRVQLWDVAEKAAVRVLSTGQGKINCLAFYENSSKLVSAGQDTTILIWETGLK